jgi:hypothetical protein
MTQHIENAEKLLNAILSKNLTANDAQPLAVLVIAESLLSIAKSLRALELEETSARGGADELQS